MRSTDFLPPEVLGPDAAGDALASRVDTGDRGTSAIERTFYDTFDGLLYAAGLMGVHEGGRLVLLERSSGAERAGVRMAPPTEPLPARALEPSRLRDALAEIIELRALLRLAEVQSRVHAFDVLDDERKTVVRVAVEQPTVVTSRGGYVPLRPRIRLVGVRGYDKELRSLRATLEDELHWRPADELLVDEALRAVGRPVAGVPSKIDVHLAPEQRADAAATTVLRGLLEVIEANVDGTIEDIDPEFLHDFRVSVRRSRSVQRELKRVFPPGELARARNEFRWLQQVTGDSRDLDVYVLEFDALQAIVPAAIRPDLDPLLSVLRHRRELAREQMVLELRSERALVALRNWAALLDELVGLPTDERPAAAGPIAELAGKRIRKVYRLMVKMGRAIDSSSPPEDYHELRKKGKELRYLLELFGAPLFANDVVKPMIKALKALQDVLGRHQDREVQVAMLRSLAGEVSRLPRGPAAVMAMGVLVERLRDDERAAREEFATRFAVFASKSERRMVKDTFG